MANFGVGKLPVACLAFALAGCAGHQMDFDIPPSDTGWQPQGVNAINLGIMAAHPADLARGQGDLGALGSEAAPAVERLWSGHPKPLPSSDISPESSADSAPTQPSAGPGQQPSGN